MTNRELQEAVIKEHPGIRLVHTSEKRTNEPISNQIACVWMDDDGKPPNFHGIWLDGESGRVVECEGVKANPNIEPAVFGLLFPRGRKSDLLFHL